MQMIRFMRYSLRAIFSFRSRRQVIGVATRIRPTILTLGSTPSKSRNHSALVHGGHATHLQDVVHQHKLVSMGTEPNQASWRPRRFWRRLVSAAAIYALVMQPLLDRKST